jgi:two-component system sensor histidine kinase ChiS
MQHVIVCVDDEEIILTTLKRQLKFNLKGDYNIEVAESSQEALELMVELMGEGVEIPVFISDQIMPGIKGDELLQRVHSHLPKTKKILLTGQASLEDVGKALNMANLYRYIAKPWNETDLVLTVQEAIQSYYLDKNLADTIEELQRVNQELQRKVETFYKFVPDRFLEFLNRKADFEQIQLGMCSECFLSVMFSDIRSFTRLSESITPDENFRFLNSYLDHMGPLIRKHSGFIDKYIGDSIMGLFESADDAIRAGIDMLRNLVIYNEGRYRAGYIPIHIGIGINTGNVMLGTIGESHRMDTTVIGDVVNIASYLEKLTKRYGVPMLISEPTVKKLKDPAAYGIRFIDRLRVKKQEGFISVYEVYDADPDLFRDQKKAMMKTFETAMDLYNQKAFEEAGKLFEECLANLPGDNVSQVYVKRCGKRQAALKRRIH